MNVRIYASCILAGLFLLGCTGQADRKRAEQAAEHMVRAMAADDRAALKEGMTAQMYTDYVAAIMHMQQAAALLAGFGKTMPKPGDIQLISATCEYIEDGRAYVHTETRVGDKQNFETLVLKKESGAWKLAGKE